MTDQTPTPPDDAPDFSWSGEASALSSGVGRAWEGLAAAPQRAFAAFADPAGRPGGTGDPPSDAAPADAPGAATPSAGAVAPAIPDQPANEAHAASPATPPWEAFAGFLSGRWALAAGLALAAAAVLLLTGGPGHPSWAALGALGLGAAVVGGFWAGGGALASVSLHPESAALPPSTPRIDGRSAAVSPPAQTPTFESQTSGSQTSGPQASGPQASGPQASGPQASGPQASGTESETARLESLLGALPELGVLMDAQGRADMVFGKPLPGVAVAALHGGLPDLAAEADRPALLDALRRAADGVSGQVAFALVGAPSRRLALSLSKTPAGDIAGILLEAPPAVAATAFEATAAPVAAKPDSPSEDAVQAAQKAQAAAETERDAAKAESAAKSRFLANMSHELRTPLNAIIGFSDIMKTKLFGPLPQRYAEYAELIHESGRHLTDLINDVLDMSKLEADRYELQREVFDAREPVSSALKLLRLQADDVGVHLRGDLPADALTVDADRRALKQIVLNLVSNALKFTPPEGRVDVTLRALSGALELVVADTGVGIAAEDLKRLGTPYEQTDAGRRAQGTGLGLSLVKALTALHGGEFSLESRLGEGSAATVRLPVLVKPGAEAPPAAT